MFTDERNRLTLAFSDIIKRRRGEWVRKGGALSEHFEVSFQHRGLEVLTGIEVGHLKDAQLFVFTRHTRSLPTPDIGEPQAPAPRLPGFVITVRRPGAIDAIRRFLHLRTVWTDERRPGWFRFEDTVPIAFGRRLPPLLSDPLEQMLGQGAIEKLTVLLTPLVFRIYRRPLLWTADAIDEFVSHSLQALVAALEMELPQADVEPEAKLEFLAGILDGPLQARCGVCGEDLLAGQTVACVRCRTPHHRECWEYGGGCSIYGCGSVQAR